MSEEWIDLSLPLRDGGLNYPGARALPIIRPCTTICEPVSLCGFSSTGFMSVVAGTPHARACNA